MRNVMKYVGNSERTVGDRIGVIAVAAIIVLSSAGSSAWAQSTLWVPADHDTIQGAIDAAVNGDTVRISPGVYFENLNTLGKSIQVVGDQGPLLTIINGSEATLGPDSPSVLTCVNGESSDTVIDGVTLSNGVGNDGPGFPYSVFPYGGGAHCVDSHPTFTNCRFINNEAIVGGGLAFLGSSGVPTVTNCEFTGNSAEDDGLAIFAVDTDVVIQDCTFEDNTTLNGQGALTCQRSDAEITNCEFHSNAGAISLKDSSGTVNGCDFIANVLMSSAPGIVFASAQYTVSDCRFIDNAGLSGAILLGGQNDDILFERCVFLDNEDSSDEGLLRAGHPIGGEAHFVHCTIVDEGTVFKIGQNQAISILNSIVVGFTELAVPIQPTDPLGSYTIEYTNVEGGFAGVGNIDVDPLFADLANDNVSLLPGSLCIDAGDPASPPDPDGSIADMGAIASVPPTSFRRGDANDDSVADIADAIATLGHLFQSLPVNCEDAVDVNDDGLRNVADAVFLLNALFSTGLGSIPAPGFTCGIDPTFDALTCFESSCP